MKAWYGAVAIGVAAAAVAAPTIVRKLANVWPSVQTAPIQTAGADAASPPGSSASTRPNPPALASPAPILPQTISTIEKTEQKPRGASGKPEPKQAAAVSSHATEPTAERPVFDVVRVDPTGETVVAGHAAPKAAVELRDGGRVIAKVDADEAGQFVVLPPPLSAGSHRLELVARDGGAPAVVSDPVTIDVTAPKPDVSRHSALPLPTPAAPRPKTSAPPERVSEVSFAAAPDLYRPEIRGFP